MKLDGGVGVIGNGAGLVMSTLDVVAYAGENHGGQRPLAVAGAVSAGQQRRHSSTHLQRRLALGAQCADMVYSLVPAIQR